MNQNNKIPLPPEWVGGFLFENQDCNLNSIPGVPPFITDDLETIKKIKVSDDRTETRNQK